MKSVTIKITTTPAVRDHLKALLPLGLYGNSVAEVAERLLCKRLLSIIPFRRIPVVPVFEPKPESRWKSVKWRQAVKERDGFKCQDCGATEDLRAHHIKAWSQFPELRHILENGITLCNSCHIARHKAGTK